MALHTAQTKKNQNQPTATVEPDETVKPGWVNRYDLAVYLCVHPQTVTQLVKDGDLPAPCWVGKSRRWRLADIDQFLLERGAPL